MRFISAAWKTLLRKLDHFRWIYPLKFSKKQVLVQMHSKLLMISLSHIYLRKMDIAPKEDKEKSSACDIPGK